MSTQGAQSDPLVIGRGLVKTYGEAAAPTTALDHAHIDIPARQLVAITGPSGSGKTTMLHCLSGLATVDQGLIRIDDVDLTALDDRDRTALRAETMGFVFQTLNLLPALTVAENVQLPLLLHGPRPDDVRQRTVTLLERVGLADRAKAFPAQLSGGEQQRVAIARALITNPSVLWADEPTGSLDSKSAAVVITLLREAVDNGTTVVLVTHSDDIAAAADHHVRMRDGRCSPAM